MKNSKNYTKAFLKVKRIEDLMNELRDKLHSVVREAKDPYIESVDDFKTQVDSRGNELIEVEYTYRFRNVRDTCYTSVPVKWLDDGYDYRSEVLDNDDDADAAESEAKRTMKAELAELARLKAKYEG